MSLPTRWQQARRGSKGFRAYRRESAVAVTGGLVAAGYLFVFESRAVAGQELLIVLASVVGAAVVFPLLELGWNYLDAPGRIVRDQLVALRNDIKTAIPAPGAETSQVWEKAGLAGIYANRRAALPSIETAIAGASRHVVIVTWDGSSVWTSQKFQTAVSTFLREQTHHLDLYFYNPDEAEMRDRILADLAWDKARSDASKLAQIKDRVASNQPQFANFLQSLSHLPGTADAWTYPTAPTQDIYAVDADDDNRGSIFSWSYSKSGTPTPACLWLKPMPGAAASLFRAMRAVVTDAEKQRVRYTPSSGPTG